MHAGGELSGPAPRRASSCAVTEEHSVLCGRGHFKTAGGACTRATRFTPTTGRPSRPSACSPSSACGAHATVYNLQDRRAAHVSRRRRRRAQQGRRLLRRRHARRYARRPSPHPRRSRSATPCWRPTPPAASGPRRSEGVYLNFAPLLTAHHRPRRAAHDCGASAARGGRRISAGRRFRDRRLALARQLPGAHHVDLARRGRHGRLHAERRGPRTRFGGRVCRTQQGRRRRVPTAAAAVAATHLRRS